MVESKSALSIRQQCALLSIQRSGLYYQPRGETPLNHQLMRLIDEQYLRTPYYGARQMAAWLRREGYNVSRKRVRRLMRLMGLTAIYPGPKTSQPNPEHRIYPYLLRGLVIDRPNQVWCTDITYIRLKRGFVYLVAVMDWYSRKVLSWRLSNSLDSHFCVEALEEALSRYGKPEIFNTDQGAQFTSAVFTDVLKHHEIRISMDGKGRWMDNVFIERLWRSVKYECVYLNSFEGMDDARQHLKGWFDHYDQARPHSTFSGRTPGEVYDGKVHPMQIAA